MFVWILTSLFEYYYLNYSSMMSFSKTIDINSMINRFVYYSNIIITLNYKKNIKFINFKTIMLRLYLYFDLYMVCFNY